MQVVTARLTVSIASSRHNMRFRTGLLLIYFLCTVLAHKTGGNNFTRRAIIDDSCTGRIPWLQVLLEEVVEQSRLARLGTLDANTEPFDRATFKKHFKVDNSRTRAIVRRIFESVMREASPSAHKVRLRCHDPIDKCERQLGLRAYTHTRSTDWNFNEIILVD